jgi:hypothetical protein
MNMPYECHNCGTIFDAWPEEMEEASPAGSKPDKIKVRCSGCYAAGFTAPGQGIFTLDISGETPQLVES